MLVTFGATLLGVMASFFLWFGGEKLIRWQHERKARDHALAEIVEEIQYNIGALDTSIGTIHRLIDSGEIPNYLARLKTSAHSSLLSSGEIRLINGSSKKAAILVSSESCRFFNDFVANTESLMAILLLRPDGLRLARHRLEGLLQTAEEHRGVLNMALRQLQDSSVAEVETMGETNNGNENSPTNEEQLAKIQDGISRIEKGLESSARSTWLYFCFALGFASITAGLGLTAVLNETAQSHRYQTIAFTLAVMGSLIILLPGVEYRGVPRRWIAIAGLLFTISGAACAIVATALIRSQEGPAASHLVWLYLGGWLALILGSLLILVKSRRVEWLLRPLSSLLAKAISLVYSYARALIIDYLWERGLLKFGRKVK